MRHFSTCACHPSCPCKNTKVDLTEAESSSESDREPDEALLSSDALESEGEGEATASPQVVVNNAGMKKWTPCPKKLGSEDTYLAVDDP